MGEFVLLNYTKAVPEETRSLKTTRLKWGYKMVLVERRWKKMGAYERFLK